MKHIDHIEYHHNQWWWGESITMIYDICVCLVELQICNDMPNMAFIKALSVLPYYRQRGIGGYMLAACEELARHNDVPFLQLNVDRNEEWLVNWYQRRGFVVTGEDDHEYRMTKPLANNVK